MDSNKTVNIHVQSCFLNIQKNVCFKPLWCVDLRVSWELAEGVDSSNLGLCKEQTQSAWGGLKRTKYERIYIYIRA